MSDLDPAAALRDEAGPWRARVGERVVVRYRAAHGGLTDALGELLAAGETLLVRTRGGDVAISSRDVVAGKVVPPRPSRKAPPHLALSITAQEQVMARHWQADERELLGDWLLRAAGGFTGRANSVLAVGDPGLPVAEALSVARGWYEQRGLPPLASLPVPVDDGVEVAGPPSTLELGTARHLRAPDLEDAAAASATRRAAAAAGWVPGGGVSAFVLVAATAELRRPAAPGLRLPDRLTVDLADEPDDGWLATYRYRGNDLPSHARRLLLSCERQVFASVRSAGRTVAVARGSLSGGWAGVTAVDVAPDHRRQGLGQVLLAELARWAWDGGALSTFLQTAVANGPAQALYLSAGFTVHHRYDYLTPAG